MEKSYGNGNLDLAQYVYQTFQPEDPKLKRIKELTMENQIPEIQISPMDGRHIEILTRLTGVKKAVEIGTLAGFSGTCIARGLQPGGQLYTFELEEKNAEIARKAFEVAEVSDRVKVFVGPALEKLPEIEKEGPFDLVFIDADKVNYPAYLEWASHHLRPGGIVMGDNTFAFGDITKSKSDYKTPRQEQITEALKTFNTMLAHSDAFRSTLLPTGEGLTVGVKI